MKGLKYVGYGIGSLTALGVLVGIGVLAYYSRDLPSLDAIENYNPRLVTSVYTDKDEVLSEFSTERRKFLSDKEIPDVARDAFVSAEDDEFFNHRGINPITMIRAALKNVKAGHFAQGGSTITQQVAKQILLSPEKSLDRKLKEILLAFRMEKALSKQQILALYLNQIFLGNGAYGIEAAAQTYFGKPAAELVVPEAAILAGLPRAPSRDNPVGNPKGAKARQTYVLGRMLATNRITKDQYESMIKEPVKIRTRTDSNHKAPYFTEHVRRYILAKYGEEQLYGGGLKVYTTVDLEAQLAAEEAIRKGLITIDKRIGLRRPARHIKTANERTDYLMKQDEELTEKHFDYKLLTPEGTLVLPDTEDGRTPIAFGRNYTALVLDKDKKTKHILVQVGNRKGSIAPEDYRWASEANGEEVYAEKIVRNPFAELQAGDLITVALKTADGQAPGAQGDAFVLEQEALVQGAFLSYAVPDGALKALVGGYDFTITRSEFNRAIQARRQPGSAFKPLLYACALDQGLTASTILLDSPIVYRDVDEKTQLERLWRPDNASDRFYGETTLRMALTYSRNIPTIKLLQHVKIPTFIEYAKKLGIKSALAPDLSLALGSSVVTPEELMAAWGVFANRGNRLPTYFIRRVEDRNGQILEERSAPPVERVIPESTAYLVTNLLQSAVEIGTGTAVKELGRPTAGKTGTTSDAKDAWFIGYVPQMISGVWIGFDEDRTIGRNETGGRSAAPIWLDYMKKATAKIPSQDFERPSDIVQVVVDSATGDIPTTQTKKRYAEIYVDGTAPGQIPRPRPDAPGASVASTPNRTLVITGNPMGGGAPASGESGSGEDPGADELFRNEL